MILVGFDRDNGEFVLVIDAEGRVKGGEIVLDEDGGVETARQIAVLYPGQAIFRADKTGNYFEIDSDPIVAGIEGQTVGPSR